MRFYGTGNISLLSLLYLFSISISPKICDLTMQSYISVKNTFLYHVSSNNNKLQQWYF